MERTLFAQEHHLFRRSFKRFLETHLLPHQERFWEAGMVDRSLWREAGAGGFLLPWLEESLGGPGGDFLHSVVVMEELARAYETGLMLPLHSDVVAPYLHSFGTAVQKQRWLPGCALGEKVCAVAMTEPSTGSDLAAITTTARQDGDHYVVNGAKTFVSNGILCDLVVVVVRTGAPALGHAGLSLLVVEAGTPGWVRGRKLRKMGLHSQDTAEMTFMDCRVPVANRLGEEGAGFVMLMQKLQQERLVVAMGSQASAEKVLEDTVAYAKERRAFNKPIAAFQNTAFKLAECATQLEVGRAFLDRLTEQHVQGKDLTKEAAMAKLWHTEMASTVVDTCLQFFGGYGYMLEYPISRAYVDARVQRIYAGTNEIMKVIIARQMGL